ncbi:hypothetical protein [Mycobacterium leprae]|uniref:hypothetical protein n=1 Tax=Mycobacterium leprae TaxID=1769 RepID=UPI0003187481|nr:hypothetical protein [Mycobacterium leprae]
MFELQPSIAALVSGLRLRLPITTTLGTYRTASVATSACGNRASTRSICTGTDVPPR